MKVSNLLMFLGTISIFSMSCKRLYDIDGRVINVCNEPVANVKVDFFGCPGEFSFTNDDFEYTTTTNSNGEFSFKEREHCKEAYIKLGGRSILLSDRGQNINFSWKQNLKLIIHYNLTPGDSIVNVYPVNVSYEYPIFFSKRISDSLYWINYVPEIMNNKVKTDYYRSNVLMSRIDSVLYDCKMTEKDLYVYL